MKKTMFLFVSTIALFPGFSSAESPVFSKMECKYLSPTDAVDVPSSVSNVSNLIIKELAAQGYSNVVAVNPIITLNPTHATICITSTK